MYQIVIFLHVVIAISVIGLVLIQHGKGADIGAAFGSGASNTVFGSQGSGGFLFKLTGFLAIAFFATSLSLGYIVSSQYRSGRRVLPATTQKVKIDDAVPVDTTSDIKNKSTTKK